MDEKYTYLESLVLQYSQLEKGEIFRSRSEVVLSRSLQLLNSFYPRIMNTTKELAEVLVSKENSVLFDVVTDPITSMGVESGIMIEEEFGTSFPYKVIGLDWDLLAIYNSKETWLIDIFERLFINYYIVISSNKRRTATLNDLPYELNGDSFYNEAKEEIENIRTILINSTPNLL